VREKEQYRHRPGTSTPSIRRGATVKIGKSGQGPRAPNNKIRGSRGSTHKSGPRGKGTGNLSLSRCGPKVKNKMAPKFEFGDGEGVGKGGMMCGGRSCC